MPPPEPPSVSDAAAVGAAKSGSAELTPPALWARYYPYVEAIAAETQTLDVLRNSDSTRKAISDSLGQICSLLAALPPDLSRRYGWAADPASYATGAEAFYQLRIFGTLRDLLDTPFRIDASAETICCRQLISPSAFNGSPRIKRFDGVAFVIFPAAGTDWMYSTFEMIAHFMGHGSFDDGRMREYLLYLIAARTFEKYATVHTLHGLDFLIDQIVVEGNPLPRSPSISNLSLAMADCADRFIVCHELAHFSLGHGGEGSVEMEAEADRRAIDMMLAIARKRAAPFPVEGIDDLELPLLGYLAVRLWTNVRLAAEMRVLPYVCEDRNEVDGMRRSMDAMRDERVEQMRLVGLTGIEAPAACRAAVEACLKVVGKMSECPIDLQEARRVRALASSFAAGDYGPLSKTLFSDVRERRADEGLRERGDG